MLVLRAICTFSGSFAHGNDVRRNGDAGSVGQLSNGGMFVLREHLGVDPVWPKKSADQFFKGFT